MTALASAKGSPLIIDCDTGRDDALSIWLTLSLGLNLVGVTTSYGNTTLENVTANTAGVLSYAGRNDIPLSKCAAQPSRDHVGFRNSVIPRQQVAGNGLCNVVLSTDRENYQSPTSPSQYADFIRRLASQVGALDYIVLGPATNFANLCAELGGDLTKTIKSVTMLGGKIGPTWDANPVADFNIICDPFAVGNLLETGIKKQFVTLDTTWDICLPLEKIKALKPTNSIGEKVREIMMAYCEGFSPDGVFRFHDPSVFLLYQADVYVQENVKINLDEESPEFGRLFRVDGPRADGLKVDGQDVSVGICDYTTIDRDNLLAEMLKNLGLED